MGWADVRPFEPDARGYVIRDDRYNTDPAAVGDTALAVSVLFRYRLLAEPENARPDPQGYGSGAAGDDDATRYRHARRPRRPLLDEASAAHPGVLCGGDGTARGGGS